ncbi:MAG: DUF4430 domain-containing protein [Lachnospira sp.]
MFDKFRPVKLAGIAIIILAVVFYIITGVRIRSVRQVQEEKESMLSMYSEEQTDTQSASIGEPSEQEKSDSLNETLESVTGEEQHESVNHNETGSPKETSPVKEDITASASESDTSEKNTSQPETQYSDKVKCTIEIRCDNAVDKKSSISNPGILNLIPDDGCILKVTEYQAEAGFTVYDVLNQVALMNDIDIVSSSDRTYVSSIGGLAQKMVGTGSGWTYRVNDELVMRPACYCKVENGDVIKWIYVTGPSD